MVMAALRATGVDHQKGGSWFARLAVGTGGSLLHEGWLGLPASCALSLISLSAGLGATLGALSGVHLVREATMANLRENGFRVRCEFGIKHGFFCAFYQGHSLMGWAMPLRMTA